MITFLQHLIIQSHQFTYVVNASLPTLLIQSCIASYLYLSFLHYLCAARKYEHFFKSYGLPIVCAHFCVSVPISTRKKTSYFLVDIHVLSLRTVLNVATVCGRTAICMEVQKTEDRINSRLQVLWSSF